MQFLNKIKNFILNKNKTMKNVFFKSSATKQTITGCATLKLSTKTEEIKKQIHEEVKTKIKKYINTPEKLIQYIQLKGIKVYRIKNAERTLSKFGEEEGFITPQRGLKAILLSIVLGKNIEFFSKEFMVFDTGKTDIYIVARALYKYYGFKKNLSGYDYKSQEIFKKIYSKRKQSTAIFEKCSIKDIMACKEALARDMESIKFTVELSQEYRNAKLALKKLKENGANV